MNWGQFKDPVSHMYHAGAVVALWSLTQEVADSNSLFYGTYFTNSVDSVLQNSFRKNSIMSFGCWEIFQLMLFEMNWHFPKTNREATQL